LFDKRLPVKRNQKGVSTINKHKLVLILTLAVGIIMSIATLIVYNYFKFIGISVSLASSLGQQQKTPGTIVAAEPSLRSPEKNTLKIENYVAPG
jgi:hypothetical protein